MWKDNQRAPVLPLLYACTLGVALLSAQTAAGEPRVYPTGVTVYDPTHAYNSFVCFSSLDGNTHLIDMSGKQVHQWAHVGLPGEIIDPQLVGGQRGHVLLQLSDGSDDRGGIFNNQTDDQGGAGFPPAALGIYAGSRILEIDPVKNQIVWQYTGDNSGRPVWSFFSSFVSSARRLPNGNTLIDEGMSGRLFQITPGGDIVWEYVNPYPGRTTVGGKPALNSLIYRAQPVPYAWVPEGTPHSETAVKEPDITTFRVPR